MVGQKIGYASASKLGHDLERQLYQLESRKVDRVFTEIIFDRRADRPALQELLQCAQEGDSLIVQSMDRLARNLADLRNIVHTLTTSGVTVTFIKEDLTFNGNGEPISVMLLSVMGGVAEFERSINNERLLEEHQNVGGHSCKLTPEQLVQIRAKLASGASMESLIREYMICQETINSLLQGSGT